MFNFLNKIFPGRAATNAPPLARILVVDDDQTTCKLIQTVLTRKGYHVRVAHDGESGFTEALGDKPDMIFLDCRLPDINGVEIGRRLKAHDLTRDIPIFFLTAVDTPQNIIDCYELGAENYLLKPVSSRELVSLVESSITDFKKSQE